VVESIISHPARESRSRTERGGRLFGERGDETRFANGAWLVPSENDLTSVHEDHLEPEVRCRCRDFEACGERGPRKHADAATLARAKRSARLRGFVCDGCGRHFPIAQRHEVMPEHAGFAAYYVGEKLCRECASQAGGALVAHTLPAVVFTLAATLAVAAVFVAVAS
jgi:hypothetical protein